MHLQQQIKIRIVYKSGYTHDFYVTKFKVTGSRYEWEACDHLNMPVVIGVDEIAAVYQIGARTRLKFGA